MFNNTLLTLLRALKSLVPNVCEWDVTHCSVLGFSASERSLGVLTEKAGRGHLEDRR